MIATVPFTWVLIFNVQAWGFVNILSQYSSMYYEVSTQKSSRRSVDTKIELDLAPGLYVLSINMFYRKFLLIHALSGSRLSVFWGGVQLFQNPTPLPRGQSSLFSSCFWKQETITSTESKISHTYTTPLPQHQRTAHQPHFWTHLIFLALMKRCCYFSLLSIRQLRHRKAETTSVRHNIALNQQDLKRITQNPVQPSKFSA